MIDQKLIDSINAHNSKFPHRKLDVESLLKGIIIKEFIKDLQEILGTKTDGVLGNDDKAQYDKIDFEKDKNYPILPIIRWGMFCKGYSGGDVNNETYGDLDFFIGLKQLLEDCGLQDVPEFNNNKVNFKLLKAIFSMDSYVLINKGNKEIREMQKILNKNTYKQLEISPCDGISQRKLIKQIIWYMQIISDDSNDMDGGFGSKTLNNYLNNFNENKNSKKFIESVKILQCLLIINKCFLKINGNLDEETNKQIRIFKTKANLEDPFSTKKTDTINEELISGLIRSCGLKSRKTICCDTCLIMNQKYLDELKSEGYSIIGRYISGTVGGKYNKALSHEEIDLLIKNKFEVFLIFQEGASNKLQYFQDESAGERDGNKINKAMEYLNIPKNNIVFVAVDCDMLEHEFRKYIIPYFEKINKIVTKYRIGVYCSRKGAQILKELNLATGFFISGASYGFNGNIAASLPDYWNFEQFCVDIYVKTVEIDKVSISFNYKDCIADFNFKEKKDYTLIVIEKLKKMENTIKERYSENQLEEFFALLTSLETKKFILFPEIESKNIITEMIWFFNQVSQKGPWDLKEDESWDKTIGISPRPVFGMPGANEYFFFCGKFINREELGYITYGYLGKAMKYPDTILYMGGGMAANGKSLTEMISKSMVNLDVVKPPYYGDSKEVHDFIEFGINLYKEKDNIIKEAKEKDEKEENKVRERDESEEKEKERERKEDNKEFKKQCECDCQYYPKTPYQGISIVDGLAAIGVNNSYKYRAQIAEKNGIQDYTGTASQNIQMLNLLKNGQLLKP